MTQKPANRVETGRNPDGTFKEGVSGNLKGRPKGKTLKEFARDFLMSMSDEEKINFMNSLSKDMVWRMAEGNPHQDTDITTAGKPLPQPIYVPGDSSSQEDSETNKEN